MDETNAEWCVIRDRLQELSELLYWQWRFRLAAWSSSDTSCISMAEDYGARTTKFIRHLRNIMCWVPYTIEDTSTVVCLSLGIRCVPMLKRPVAVLEEPEASVDPAPTVPSQACPPRNNIGFGTTRLPCNNIGFYRPTRRTHAPVVTRQVGGRGMWRRPGPSPTACPPSVASSAMVRQDSIRGRGPWRGPTVPTPATTESGQSVGRGGRFMD